MADYQTEVPAGDPQSGGARSVRARRARRRAESLTIDKEKVANRIADFYQSDMLERSDEMESRLQRYAKYRMWTEGKNWPWEDCSDAAIPDLMQHSLRVQDTLHNAVMSIRPSVISKAHQKRDKDKQDAVDNLIDYQMFEEQTPPGEAIIGALIEDFVNDGLFTCYIPWVRDKREVHDIRTMPRIPDQVMPIDYFRAELETLLPGQMLNASDDGWDWKAIDRDGNEVVVSFYTRDDQSIEIDLQREAVVCDGPRMIRKDCVDVLHPARCENLQISGPANPMGAMHVILRDYPSLDEIRRLAKSKYYDLATEEELAKLGVVSPTRQYQEREEQKDVMQGVISARPDAAKGAESHKRLTRLQVFDCYDIDGDGTDEDVIWTMILETKTLLRARLLTQMFPSVPPRRPFAEAQFIPVPGRRLGIGQLEMMEGLHDLKKQITDQTVDGGTLKNVPFFFYRSTSNMRPETIRLWPGEGYPLTDPKNDVNFPAMPNQGEAFGFNMISLITQEQEKLTTTGDLQFGRVPQGKASALRTVQGMQTVLAQGDARPERILRRFFIGLTEVVAQFHELNQRFLPKGKQYRIAGYTRKNQDPYRTINDVDEIEGRFSFGFMANALNTNKQAVQQALGQLMGTYISQLNIQLGIVNADGAYRLQYDFGKSWGLDPDRYLTPPSPTAFEPNILAEEAVNLILSGELPQGVPVEGAQTHLKRIMEFVNTDEFGHLTPNQVQLMKEYLAGLQQRIMQDAQKAALLQATAQLGTQGGGPGGGVTPQQGGGQGSASDIQKLPPISGGGELVDESLPGAGGGGNPGP